jgi:O-acetylserine/cysteine efflux transporter
MTAPPLSLRHALLALAVTIVWGTNFVVIKVGLGQLPPLTFAALRFALAFAPAALFLKRPDVPIRNLAAFGVLIGLGQFGLLYIAMHGMISPGLASLVIQSQVFMTIGLAMWLTRERLRSFQWIALAVGGAGLVVIFSHTDALTTVPGHALVLVGALCWALGNTVQRSTPSVNSLAYVVWSSLFSVPPLVVVALLLEGWPAVSAGVAHASATTWAVILWQSLGNTIFGYGAWGFLLARYPAAVVSPFALLIPVFGMGASALLLGEPLPGWKLAAAALILSGLAVNLLGPRLARTA